MCLCISSPAIGQTDAACPATHINETAQVKYVHDGDTLILRDGRKVRLIGIDTPELARKNKPTQPFAIKSRNALRQLVADARNSVQLQFGPDRHDRYSRLLAHVYSPTGINLNATLIERGLAVAITIPANDTLSDCYHRLDRQSQHDKNGLWSHSRYQPVSSSDILDTLDGFHRIRAQIDRTKQTSKGIWLTAGVLGIHIRAKDFQQFDTDWLLALTNKTILIRGWLRKDKFKPDSKRYFSLRHPSSIESIVRQ